QLPSDVRRPAIDPPFDAWLQWNLPGGFGESAELGGHDDRACRHRFHGDDAARLWKAAGVREDARALGLLPQLSLRDCAAIDDARCLPSAAIQLFTLWRFR